MFSCEFCEISKNTFLHRTTPVTAFQRQNGQKIKKYFKKSSEILETKILEIFVELSTNKAIAFKEISIKIIKSSDRV